METLSTKVSFNVVSCKYIAKNKSNLDPFCICIFMT